MKVILRCFFFLVLFSFACTERIPVETQLRLQAQEILYQFAHTSNPNIQGHAVYYLNDLQSKSLLDSVFEKGNYSWDSQSTQQPSALNNKQFRIQVDLLKQVLASGDLEDNLSMLSSLQDSSFEERFLLCITLAESGDTQHLPLLSNLMYMTNPIISIETIESPQEHPWNLEVSSAAAYAILCIVQKVKED